MNAKERVKQEEEGLGGGDADRARLTRVTEICTVRPDSETMGPFLDYVPITTGAPPSSAEGLIMRQPPAMRGR